jgi:protein tyrosine phosphatase
VFPEIKFREKMPNKRYKKMSIHSIGPFNPQASVEEQLQILSESESNTVKAFASKTLESWHGRSVSNGDISNAIDTIAKLVENAMESSQLSHRQADVLTGALKALQETGSQIQRIGSVAKKPLGLEPDIKLETALEMIDQSTLPSHPAFHSDWTRKMAESALQLPSVPIGSYVLIGNPENLTIFVKEMREQVSSYPLSKAEGKGFTIEPEEEDSYYSGSGDESGYADAGRTQEPLAPPAVLGTLVTPLGPIKPQVMKLLLFKEKLEKVALSEWGRASRDWEVLKGESEKVKAPPNRPQQNDTDTFLKSSVDVINLAPDTAVKLERDGRPVFFHGNTVKVNDETFICHQLPTDHSRDDLWLSLWENAGSNPQNSATIIKLSTPDCPLAGDIPIIRSYTPLSKDDPEAANFERTCMQALAKLDGNRRIKSLEANVSKYESALERAVRQSEELAAEIGQLKTGLESEQKDSEAYTSLSSQLLRKEGELDKLQDNTALIKRTLNKEGKELTILREAIVKQKNYILEQLEDFRANKEGSGPTVGLFTTQDGITVKLEEEKKLEGFPGAIVRKFTMEKSGEASRRTVTQIDYPNWADFGASSARTLNSLRDVYKKEHKDNPSPALVHCRAGVGRTGTFAVYCGVSDQIERAARLGEISALEPKKLLFDTIIQARAQRDFQVVQTPVQGQQIIEALKESLTDMIRKDDAS